MNHELVVGLYVKDHNLYKEYRKAMTPLLETYGGGFRYDFEVSKTLIPASENEINRVFLIYFRDKQAREEFFSHPTYLAIKAQYFEKSVAKTVIISEY